MRTLRVVDVLGLPTSIAARFLQLKALLAALPARNRDAADHPTASGLESLPEITFDLSFLSEPPPAGLATIAAEPTLAAAPLREAALPEITFDLSSLAEAARRSENAAAPEPRWRERSLEDWFRQRAAEVAQRALERRQPSPLDGFARAGHAN